MRFLIRALHAERLKLRDTLALWLCVLTPLIMAMFGMLMIWSNPFVLSSPSPPVRWQMAIDTVFGMWASLMLPLLVTLEAALLAGLEHANHQWKHLLLLPLPRYSHYLAKLLTLLGLIVLATLVLCLLIPLGAYVLTMAVPQIQLSGFPPWGYLFGRALATVVAALLVISLQLFIAIRWPSFTVAMTCGIAATIAAMFMPKDGIVAKLFPWSMPAMSAVGHSDRLHMVLAASIAGFCIATALGAWDFARREHS